MDLLLNRKPATLLPVHIIIYPLLFHKFLMSTCLCNTSLFQDNYPVSKCDIGEAVTYQDGGSSFNYLPEPAEYLKLCISIQGT